MQGKTLIMVKTHDFEEKKIQIIELTQLYHLLIKCCVKLSIFTLQVIQAITVIKKQKQKQNDFNV